MVFTDVEHCMAELRVELRRHDAFAARGASLKMDGMKGNGGREVGEG